MKLLFPTVIHEIPVKNFKSIKKELIDFVYDQQQRDPKGVAFSNLGGWQSQPVYYQQKNILSDIVSQSIGSYFEDNVLKLSNAEQIKVDGLWININRRGDSNLPHDHPLSNIAGVFWINSPIGCGVLEFQSPHHFTGGAEMELYTDEFREKTNSYPTYWITPKEGTISLFPSSLVHRVRENETDVDRISASFNLQLHK